MSENPGTIGSYEVLREIGRGGMGVVYLARDTKLDRDVAIKTLPGELAEDADRLARFEREAKTLAQLNHTNIAGIYGIEEQDGQKYLILEYVEGETLAERLDRGALPIDEAMEVCIQIAAGIEAAHEAGIIHRDLKPDNIKISGGVGGTVKVLDFGIARAEEPTGTGSSISDAATLTPTTPRSPTEPGQVLGTAPYMSPEQARGRRLDKRSDIWSFGVLLYECLTGISPFIGETVSDSIGAILHKDVDLDRLPSGSSPMLRHVIGRCLQRDKNKRLRDIGDARLELMAIASGERDDDGAATATSTMRAMLIGAAAVVLVAGLTGLGVWRSMQPEPPRVVHLALPQPQDKTWFTSLIFNTFAISRDGQSIVYRSDNLDPESGDYPLVIRHLAQTEPVTLTDLGTVVSEPFFSPDGQWIGYTTIDEVRAVPASGGTPRRICSCTSLPGEPRGLTWRSDGLVVFGTDGGGLFSVPADGGTPESLTTLAEGERGHLWPDAIAGTDLVLFTNQKNDAVNLAWYDLGTGRQGLLLEGAQFPRYLEPGYLLYVQDGTLRADTFDPAKLQLGGNPTVFEEQPESRAWSAWAAYAVSRDGTLVYSPASRPPVGRTLVWIDRQGQESPTLFGTGPYGHIAMSPSGAKVAIEQYLVDEFSVWVGDIRSETKTRFSAESGFNPIWSPDGKQIIWTGLEVDTVCRQAADGAGSVEKYAARGVLRSVTPDGEQFVVSRQGQDTSWDLWIAPMRGEAKPFIVEAGFQYDCAFSSDGRWVAYRSNLTGRSDVFVSPYPDVAEEKARVPGGGNKSRPIWSRDGSELFYIKDGTKLMVAPVTTTPTLSIGQPMLLYADLDARLAAGMEFAPMPDGQRFLVIKEDPSFLKRRPEIHVVVNWIEELKAKFEARQ